MKKEYGFTLSEVIITLVVLGIVAAITVPMLSNSASDKKWNVARQKVKATIGEAFRLMTINGEISTKNADGTDRTTEYMVTKVLPKYLKLDKTCIASKYSDCGFPSKVKELDGAANNATPDKWTWIMATHSMVWNSSPTKMSTDGTITGFSSKYGNTYNLDYFFRTLDGFSVAFFYNPYCVSNSIEHYTWFNITENGRFYRQQVLDRICFMGIYDMNGKKGPNQFGKDIGVVGSFFNGFETTTAAVLPYQTLKDIRTITNSGSNSFEKALNYCNNLKEKGDWKIPDIYELSLLYLTFPLHEPGIADPQKILLSSTAYPDMPGANFAIKAETAQMTNFSATYTYSGNSSYGPWIFCTRANSLK